jgi:catechol 2,3-dioxygenase-like lactoylglutathione lyase family enzyme
LHTAHPRSAAEFYVQHLGFEAIVDLEWFVCLQHPDHSSLELALVQKDHEAVPESYRGESTANVGLAFFVEDVDAEAARLTAAGVQVLLPAHTEPWGQRRFQLRGPGGAVVEVLQVVEPDPQWMTANVPGSGGSEA